MENMKKLSPTSHRSLGSVMYGARSITLAPSVRIAGTYISKNGVASDWKRVGQDLKKSMGKFEREPVG